MVLRDVLGLEVEEFLPLRAGEAVLLDRGCRGHVWAEHLVPQGAETMLSYVDGPAAGGPAVTRHRLDRGQAWYVSTGLRGEHLDTVLADAYRDAGLASSPDLPAGLEVVRRVNNRYQFTILVNHEDVDVPVAVNGVELLTGAACAGTVVVPAGEVRVVREPLAGHQ